jgi:hypothetical protein
MHDIDVKRLCVVANMKRVLEILESDLELKATWQVNKINAELKNKMKEIRRDMIAIHNHLKY